MSQIPSRELIHELNSEQTNLQRTGISDASDVATIEVAGDILAPSAPTGVTANSVPDGVKLDWLNTSLNEDGTACVDLRWVKIYYSTSTPVITSDSSYVVAARAATNSSFVDSNVGTTTDMYYAISSIDSSGNESGLSSEVTATGGGADPNTDIPSDADGYVFDTSYQTDGVGVGYGIIGIVFQIPQSTWKNFDRYRLFFDVNHDGAGFPGTWNEIEPVNRTSFIHKGLDIDDYYKYRASIVAKDGTEREGEAVGDGYDVADNGGAGYKPSVDSTTMFDDTVLVGNLVSANEVRGEHFFAESYLRIGTDSWQGNGIQLNHNGGDPRAYIGSGGVTASDRYFMFDDGKISWRGANSSLTEAGVFTATSAIITGNITMGSGSTLSASYITGGTLNASTITVTNLNATNITTGTLSTSRIANNSLTGSQIQQGTLYVNNLSVNGSLDMNDSGIFSCPHIWGGTVGTTKSLILVGGTYTSLIGYNANCYVTMTSTTTTLHGNSSTVISNTSGDIWLNADDDIDLDADGYVLMPNLQTSDPGIAGAVWRSGIYLRISTG